MKLKIIRWIGLIAGSVLSIFIAGAIIFVGANFIGGISDGIQEPIIGIVVDFIDLLTAFLLIVGVVIAWFNTKVGSILITSMAMVHVIAFYETEVAWLQISILFVGLILLFYVYYNRWLLKKGES